MSAILRLVQRLRVRFQRLDKAAAAGAVRVLVAPPHVLLLGLGEVARAARDLEHSLQGAGDKEQGLLLRGRWFRGVL